MVKDIFIINFILIKILLLINYSNFVKWLYKIFFFKREKKEKQERTFVTINYTYI